MDLKNLLEEYLSKNKLVQLATVSGGQPWLCNVYFVTDKDNYIYWTSSRSRRHSKEIFDNSVVASTIVHDHDKKQALQITGEAFEVDMDDVERVDNLYSEKYGYKDRLSEVKNNKPDRRAYYVLKPNTIHFWDEVNFPDNPKQVYK